MLPDLAGNTHQPALQPQRPLPVRSILNSSGSRTGSRNRPLCRSIVRNRQAVSHEIAALCWYSAGGHVPSHPPRPKSGRIFFDIGAGRLRPGYCPSRSIRLPTFLLWVDRCERWPLSAWALNRMKKARRPPWPGLIWKLPSMQTSPRAVLIIGDYFCATSAGLGWEVVSLLSSRQLSDTKGAPLGLATRANQQS